MVEYQCGTLSKTSKGEEVTDVISTSLDIPPTVESDETPLTVLGDEVVDLLDRVSGEVTNEVIDEDPRQNPELVLPDLDVENWMSKLHEDEIFNADKGPAPRLHGLRRLAKPYILTEESKVNALIVVPRQNIDGDPYVLRTLNGEGDVMSQSEQLGTFNFPMASVTFNITLRDGRTFSDSADAFYSNCEKLGLFPTAVASARAEARCLRKVLGIREHAAEELVDKDAGEELAPNDGSPIKPEQTKLIDKMLKTLDTNLKELLEAITTREVFSVEELTTGEARKALRLLNDQKKKKKKGGKK